MNCMSLKKYIAKAMILALLKEKDTDGYEIALETARYTNFPKGKIYPLLLHFRKNRLISAYFRKSESGFFRKYYKITPPGRLKHLSNMTDTQYLYHMIRKILITGGMKMTRTEFMSLLQYYLKKAPQKKRQISLPTTTPTLMWQKMPVSLMKISLRNLALPKKSIIFTDRKDS